LWRWPVFPPSCFARVVTWDDLLRRGRAWDALIWFGTGVMMSDALNGIRRHPHPLQRALSRDARWSWPVVAVRWRWPTCTPLCFRQPDGACDGALPEFSLAAGVAGRRAAAGDGSVLAFFSSLEMPP